MSQVAGDRQPRRCIPQVTANFRLRTLALLAVAPAAPRLAGLAVHVGIVVGARVERPRRPAEGAQRVRDAAAHLALAAGLGQRERLAVVAGAGVVDELLRSTPAQRHMAAVAAL